MDKTQLFEKVDEFKEVLGTEEKSGSEMLLTELCKAMGSYEFEDYLKYIDRMWDTNLF